MKRAAGFGIGLALAGLAVFAAVSSADPAPSSLTAPAVIAPEFQAALGPSITQFAGSHFPTGSARNGITVGVAGRWPLSPRWTFRTGLSYVERGTVLGSEAYALLTDQPTGVVKLTYELAYAEVPLLLGWSLPARESRITVFAGPAVAVKLSEWVHQTGVEEVKVRRDDLQDEDLLGQAGIALETLFSGRHVIAEAVYDEGLVNVLRPTVGGDTVRNTGLRVQVGIGTLLLR